jgi:predicted nuclease of predicted toxin-antitoxin system
MISFYFDEHMPRAVADGLRSRDIQVIMAVDVEMEGKADDEHLRYATEQNTVLVTRDKPFAGRIMSQADHAGLICWTGEKDISGMVRRLSEFAEQNTAEEVKGRVFWLKS